MAIGADRVGTLVSNATASHFSTGPKAPCVFPVRTISERVCRTIYIIWYKTTIYSMDMSSVVLALFDKLLRLASARGLHNTLDNGSFGDCNCCS